MFDLDTSIHIVGLVIIVVCVEDLPDWWNLIYATSLIVLVFMRFHGYFDLCILYMVMITHVIFCIMPIHGHCTLMYLGMLYVLAVICRDICTILLDG